MIGSRRMVAVLVALGAFWASQQSALASGWMGFTMGRGSSGVAVRRVLPGSPAEKAGLHPGDQVVAVDGKAVKTPGQVLGAVRGKGPGQSVSMTLLRGGAKRAVSLRLAARPSLQKLLRLLFVGRKAPSFSLKATDGSQVRLAGLRGKVVMIEFWATWCASCKISLKKLTHLYRKLRSRGFLVLAPARNSLAETQAEARKLRLPFPVLADPGAKVARRYHFSKTPTLALVDRKGVIRNIWVGSSYSERAMEAQVRRILAEK